MSFSNYLENKILQYYFGKISFIPASTLYLALSRDNPTDSGVGLDEPAESSGYYRVAIDNHKSVSGWSNSVSIGDEHVVYNNDDIIFGDVSGDWGNITHFALIDEQTGGNIYGYGTVNVPHVVESGDIVEWDASNLSVRLF